MLNTTHELAEDIKRYTADLRKQLDKLDGYADALAAVTPDDQPVAARYAPDRIGDMFGTFNRSSASATVNLLQAAARTALSANE